MAMPRDLSDSTASSVLRLIQARRRGAVFVPTDFAHQGTREAIDAALSRLARDGTIRRLCRGVYDYPKKHPRFGLQAPSVDAVARAIARGTGEDIVIGNAKAASLLGITTQVPARAVFLTDGTNRTLHITVEDGGGFDIQFRRSTRRAGGDSKAGIVLRALRFLGRDGIEAKTIRKLRRDLDDNDKRRLLALQPKAEGWMWSIIGEIVNDDIAKAS